MKKFIKICMVTAGIMIFAACGQAANGGGAATPPAAGGDTDAPAAATDAAEAGTGYINLHGMNLTLEPVELMLWLPYEDWADAMIEAFTAMHPNVIINFQEMGYTEGRGAMALDGPAGLGADIFAFPHDQFAFAMADGLIEPIPEGLQAHLESQLISTAIGTTLHNGRMHTVPFQVENIALFYNRDLWGNTPPATWEEVLEFSQGWNDPANNQWTMTWEAGVGFHNFIWLTAGGMELFGPDNDDFRNIGFDSPGAALGLEYYLRMRQLFDIPMADINWNTGEERFRLGEIPLTITGPWAIHETLQNGVNFGVTRFPTIEGRQPYAFSGVMQVAVSSYSLNKPWAYAFAEFMVSPEGATILYEYRHMMTTRIDVELIPGLSDDPYLLGIAEQSPFTIPMPTIPEVSFMWTPLDELFQFVWDGDLTIAESQERAMETYRTLLTVAGIDTDF